MERPLIGITTYPPNADNRFNLPAEYVAAVRRAGADVVLVPPGTDDAVSLVSRLDGLVLSGGGDLDPSTYGGAGHETIYARYPDRDADELALARWVLETDFPTLAICRGHQVVNVALGGTLVAHLPDLAARRAGPPVVHRIEPAIPREPASPTPHPVSVDPASRLAAILGETDFAPVSWHHQAIDRLAAGLHVVATAPDGTIEATEHPDHPQLVSVQWHPEMSAATDVTQQRLFDDLVRRSRDFRHPAQRSEKDPS